MPTYWRRDIPRQGGSRGGPSGREAGMSIVAYIAGAIGLFVGAGLLVAFL